MKRRKIIIDRDGVSTIKEEVLPDGAVLTTWDEYNWWIVVSILILAVWFFGVTVAGLLIKGCP